MDKNQGLDNLFLHGLMFLIACLISSASIASQYDVDGNGADDALTDGLLVLRHQFGLEGISLTAGALASDATITSPEAIGSYIDARVAIFDLDGNGSMDALTDGLLLLRYLFGLDGDALTNGVIGSGATRDSSAEISAHIAGTSPPVEEKLRFVYQSKCTQDSQGNEVCFSTDEAGFQDVVVGNSSGGDAETGFTSKATFTRVSSDYGTIKVQTIIDQWPDGEVFEDSNGNKSFSIKKYDGYLQNRVADNIDFSTLDIPAKVARWAAPAVVQVYGDTCMLGQNEYIDWRFSSEPRTGFFIAPDLIITEVNATASFEEQPVRPWAGGNYPNPFNPEEWYTCQNLVDEFEASGAQGITFEVGAGPIVQTFDGSWGAGAVVASDGNFAIIKLSKGSKDKNVFVENWASWDSIEKETSVLQLAPADISRESSIVTLHHPDFARDAGGWHATTAEIINNCDEYFYFGDIGGDGADVYAVDFWSDAGSIGAPLLNHNGYVVGMIKEEYYDTPDNCYGIAHPGKNSLGVLSTFFADPNQSTVALGSADMRAFVESYDAQQASILNTDAPVITSNPNWPVSGNTLATTNYEVIDYGDAFTVSGFPRSELNSSAFDTAKQGTVMYVKANGCTNCAAGDLTEDFSDSCICTGFAVSKNLIVVNDHCVTFMSVGDENTFKTFQGQIVNAKLVNRTGLDVGDIYKALLTDITWNDAVEGAHRGDVALLRTDQEMNLEPIQFADSSLLVRREPLITVGHPALMLRSGPYVTSGGAFIGLNMDERSTLHYTLPAAPGASGSGVFDLNGRLVGQLAYGSTGYDAAQETWMKSEFNKLATEIDPSATLYDLQPRPFLIGPRVQVGLGASTSGASSNYIKDLINYWAPGELPE